VNVQFLEFTIDATAAVIVLCTLTRVGHSFIHNIIFIQKESLGLFVASIKRFRNTLVSYFRKASEGNGGAADRYSRRQVQNL
jgi:hypothetical protein